MGAGTPSGWLGTPWSDHLTWEVENGVWEVFTDMAVTLTAWIHQFTGEVMVVKGVW